MGNPYPVQIADAGGGTVKVAGDLTFTDPANQPGGGSSLVDGVQTVLAVVPGNQSILATTFTLVTFVIDGSDPIGITDLNGDPIGAGAGQLCLPAGHWYLVTPQFYWAADVDGSRYAGFQTMGRQAVGVSNLAVDVVCSAAEYAILDSGQGLTFGPCLFYVAEDSPLPLVNLAMSVYQDSGGALDLLAGPALQIQQVT